MSEMLLVDPRSVVSQGCVSHAKRAQPFRLLRLLSLWLALAGLGVALPACNGKLFINSPCANVECPSGTVCNNGLCVSDGVPTCNPLNVGGACASTTQTCLSGTCYDSSDDLTLCSATVNGLCANNGSCQNGECVAITADTACSLDHPSGLCPGGQTCVFGYCYADDGNVLCSATNRQGACEVGQSCISGVCQAFTGTCGPTNLTGTCGTWQVCSEGDGDTLGVCVGPVPPDGCSATLPNGRCPADEVCVAGTCTPFASSNVCAPVNPTGLCAAGSTCSSGYCTSIDPNTACSSTYVTGICPASGVCRNGTCESVACGLAGGYACASGQWCDDEACVPLPCDPVHPTGACSDSTLACVNGICASPTCAAENPYGVCAQGLTCFAGECMLPACSLTSPNGPCFDTVNQVCEQGVCVIGPCSTTRPDGACDDLVCTNDPVYGCILTMESTCCNSSLSGKTGCSYGTCSIPACSKGDPNGWCPEGQICQNGTCQQAACGPFYLSGTCSDPNKSCIQGRCTKTGCTSQGSDQNSRDAYCFPDVCDTATGDCRQAPCSATVLDGTCTSNQACCNPNYYSVDPGCSSSNVGTCYSPACSKYFPGGSCSTGQVCASGACVTPACSAAYPNGACGANYKCTSGTCVRQACSSTYPGGTCATGKVCSSGTCKDYVCSSTFPQAPCANGNLLCINGACTQPDCSTTYPGGKCTTPQVCASGVCMTPPCSSSVQTGTCPAHEVCCNSTLTATVLACSSSSYGKCVEYNCSSSNPDGTCQSPNVCVSYTKNGNSITDCEAYKCSAAFPTGPCSVSGQTCSNGNCIVPACDANHISGTCPGNFICTGAGGCVQPACNSANPNTVANPNKGYCPYSQECSNGNCIRSACAQDANRGTCATGKTCCNSTVWGAPGCPITGAKDGTCIDMSCSASFPYGTCSNANLYCVNAKCVNPCSGQHLQGWCPGGYACVEGACVTACTNDQDCDNISDADEGLATLVDTDGDGIPDAYDLDSDNDGIPDRIEAGDTSLSTPPLDTDGDGVPNFRSQDSDGDFIPDWYEAGPAPAVPRDTDSDGIPDYIDTDSDGDGILDRCEAIDIAGKGICANHTLLTKAQINGSTAPNLIPADTDQDGIPDYRSTDSDGDGVKDHIEARYAPADDSTFSSTGVDHDGDGIPDYRDLDSDGDGVLDADEDVNGNGIVDCQVDGSGTVLLDSRTTPVCNQTTSPFSSASPYNYNPGCVANGKKCLLAETNRVFADTDGNGIPDQQDGIYLVCSAENLKPVNLFFSQAADYAFALETTYATAKTLTANGNTVGVAFDDPNQSNGSYSVSGFLLTRVPDPNAMSVTNSNPNQALIQKALAQAAVDQILIGQSSSVSSVSLVINRNFTSFDGYGVVLSRFSVVTKSSMQTSAARNAILSALGSSVTGSTVSTLGPSGTTFTLLVQTLYRYDNGSTGRVLTAAAISPTGSSQDTANSYSYRTMCPSQTSQSACTARVGCQWTNSTCVQTDYQLPLFYADNITNGSALTQYGDDLQATCQSLIQENAKLDFLWTIDNSGSMTPKIGRVANASALFFPLLNTTEADYRVSMVSTSTSSNTFPPIFGTCDNETSQTTCESSLYAGGCSWDSTAPSGQRCKPMCTPFDGNQTTCKSKGCVYTASNPVGTRCQWAGCEALSTQSLCVKYDCKWSNGACRFVGLPDRVNGVISHDFTGAIAGIVSTTSTDRSVNYSCSEGCTSPNIGSCPSTTSKSTCQQSSNCVFVNNACVPTSSCTGSTEATCPSTLGCAWNGSSCVMNCCPTCLNNTSAVPNDPACYFAARLPNDTGSGSEFGLLMTEWALYRGGVQPGCAAQATQTKCLGTSGCIWTNNTCMQGYCAWDVTPADPSNHANNLLCNGTTPTSPAPQPSYSTPYPGQDLMPANCEWDSQVNGGTCMPSVGVRCASYAAANSLYGTTAAAQTACSAQSPRCQWNSSQSVCEPGPSNATSMCNATSQSTCILQSNGFCQWDACNYSNASACGAVSGCSWNGSACVAVANGGACRPPLKRMMRANATPVSFIVSDEEECYVKDGPGNATAYNGACPGGYFSGGLMYYNDPVRLARVESYTAFLNARDVLAFTLTGDKANPKNTPPISGPTNGGCVNYNGYPEAYAAEPGQAYVDVAEGTGGGWGSLCADNLYPSIEAMVTGGLGKASPYRLSGYIGGNTIQPVSSTIKVAVQTCINAAEYPTCASGTKVTVVPRSRDNGFDYDSVYNSLILYGSARPVVGGSITVSYRYWENLPQSPQGSTCPCPETSSPGCACPSGEKCGQQGSTNTCTSTTSQTACNKLPGCLWNAANGGVCQVSGLCEPDPTCGGSCAAGTVCDPSLGLCVCDPSCGNSCSATSTCDNNENIHPCQGVSQASCSSVSGCSWNSTVGVCQSTTCGQCLCDTTCGGGCAAGSTCDSNTGSSTCGACKCDTTCSGGCPNNEVCNTDTTSPTCGLCQPPTCDHCPTGFICNNSTQTCSCDTTCGGSCAAGYVCDSKSTSATCGQCQCDTTCGGGCPVGEVCNTNASSGSCGFCQVDVTCGGCNATCSGTTETTCNAASGCRWAPWLNSGAGGCTPVACKSCDASTGVCGTDTSCCGSCGPNETCNQASGQCQCDTTCGGCPSGQVCNTNTSDTAKCGSCQCDTTCGGGCPTGEVCNTDTSSSSCGFCYPDPTCGVAGQCNPTCSATTSAACGKLTGCQWQSWGNSGAGSCGPMLCKVCSGVTGLCTVDTTCCNNCGPGQVCNVNTGGCMCDTSCSGGCQTAGQICDTNLNSGTCGQCVCDTTCGGSCPSGQICDTSLTSGTCGSCVTDTTCGGGCTYPTVCNTSTGLCGTDPACGGCSGNYQCNLSTGRCEPKSG